MKKFSSILFILFLCFVSCQKKTQVDDERKKEVVIYSYDSFISEWGSGPSIAKKFQEETGYTVIFVNCGDAASILSKAIIEKENPASDVLLGIDNNLFQKAKNENVLESYKPKNYDNVIFDFLKNSFGNDNLLTPYDFSKFAIIYDTHSNVSAPKSLQELCKKEYEKSLIIMDPRTSTPGLGFLSWTIAAFGSEYETFWKNLKPSILSMAPSWSSGYGLFTKGEAPLVISYQTSPAYHLYDEKSSRYVALSFSDGHVMQVEGAGVTRGAPNKTGAHRFLDFLISENAQSEIPIGQWMYPSNKNVTLPKCYNITSLENETILSYDVNELSQALEKIFSE